MRRALRLLGRKAATRGRKAATRGRREATSGQKDATGGRAWATGSLNPAAYGLTLAACGLALAACSAATPSPTAQANATPAPTVTGAAPTPGNLPHSLTIWLTPRFAPDLGSSAGPVLLERLQAFKDAHPDLQLTIRVKAESGPGGLSESLAAASRAASGTLPDLALLPPGPLAEAGPLLIPSDELDLPAVTFESYDFARPAGSPADQAIGVPFASDLELFAYRTAAFDGPPMSWQALFTDQSTFLIPASDPDSRFLFAQYLAAGGAPDALETGPLAASLGFLESANSSGVLAPSSLDFASSAETWAAFLAGRSDVAAAPYSAFIAEYHPLDYGAGPLPTSDGRGISLAKTWSWATLSNEAIVVELLEWLTDPEFSAEWSYALGLVPARPAVLALWPETPETAIASRLVVVAVPLPDPEARAAFGPALAAALRAVLMAELTPEQAAAMAASSG